MAIENLKKIALLLGLITAGCTALVVNRLDQLYGEAVPKEFIEADAPLEVEFTRDVQPVLERRCVVCHGCYDAPCQLKLESLQGILRGASKQHVYAIRLFEADLTRLHEDAQTTQAWRNKGFYPVINERGKSANANIEAGVMARILALKQKYPLPADKILPQSFDLSLAREQQCPRIEEFDDFAKDYPLWGMPYALPGLPQQEYHSLLQWLKTGAGVARKPEIGPFLRSSVEKWEAFFNGDSKKQQLMSRYIYEHLFLAHIYFQDAGKQTVYFRLVRSNTSPGTPIDRINTRRPYDHHGSARVYYRLWRHPGSIVVKNHMPYLLNGQRMSKWHSWFIEEKFEVTELPGYNPSTTSNPFITFHDLPIQSRHKFLLDEAQFTVMNFMKGSVCRGPAALNVIRDRFWVFFTDPNLFSSKEYSLFLAKRENNLQLPGEADNGILSIRHWHSYAKAQHAYIEAKAKFMATELHHIDRAKHDIVWSGDGSNLNAALTVYRHVDSASVVQGLVGEPPLTAWVIDYPVLERIHYLLVAGFDVFGNISHQTMTRLYADFLRMESEMNFLSFLPREARKQELEVMYRDAMDPIKYYLNTYEELDNIEPNLNYSDEQPKKALYKRLRKHLAPVLSDKHYITQSSLPLNSKKALSRLQSFKGKAVSLLPQVALVNIDGYGVVTLIHNNAYTNVASIFHEKERRLPGEDTISVVNGIIGAYPNALLSITAAQIPELVELIIQLQTESDYAALIDQFGIRRTDSRFWSVSDVIHEKYQRAEPVHSGILDFNRLENR